MRHGYETFGVSLDLRAEGISDEFLRFWWDTVDELAIPTFFKISSEPLLDVQPFNKAMPVRHETQKRAVV
jgi:hypothetical protein